jgi:UDP-N-acetylmuramoyl-L-alanyl-D-glutamate--2,6-diaminopimelate ligase
MEVSSHALVQSRVEGIHFDVGVFTNLSHDHLDYHGTMEEYFEAKARLFTPGHALRGIVNADDPWGRRLLERARIPMVGARRADVTDIVLEPGHTEFTWRGQRITTPLTGAINVDNTLLAAEAALALDEPDLGPVEIARAMGNLSPVAGRMQVITAPTPRVSGQGGEGKGSVAEPGGGERPPFTVFVDYAHTPAGLELVLGEARTLAPGGRVLCVFGCGGNRDRVKRPVMGGVAVRLSDVAFLTSDNPRDEDPVAIAAEVLGGVPGGSDNPRIVVELDRGVAIRRALDEAKPGDVVLIAGKGHEAYQEVAGERLPFDDAVEARRALSVRFASDPSTWGPSATTAPPGGVTVAPAAPVRSARRGSHPGA